MYVRPHDRWLADGQTLDDPKYAYVKAAVAKAGAKSPLWIEVRSALPIGSGLGSSAAVTVATLAALHGDAADVPPAKLARQAFEVELEVQGRASPIDTTTATAGGAILALPREEEGLLWSIEREDRRWSLHQRSLPSFALVVGFTGIEAPTGPLVAKVRSFVDSDPRGAAWIEEIGRLTLVGLRALRAEDWVAAGEVMDRNHEVLNALGVGHPLLEKLVAAARPSSFGAKLTGAGGGGSMIALTADPETTSEAITAAGGRAFTVHAEPKGVVKM